MEGIPRSGLNDATVVTVPSAAMRKMVPDPNAPPASVTPYRLPSSPFAIGPDEGETPPSGAAEENVCVTSYRLCAWSGVDAANKATHATRMAGNRMLLVIRVIIGICPVNRLAPTRDCGRGEAF